MWDKKNCQTTVTASTESYNSSLAPTISQFMAEDLDNYLQVKWLHGYDNMNP